VGDGRLVGDALRHLHTRGDEPDSDLVARELAFFLVARCEARHAGWRTLRQVVLDSGAEAPWEKCARRAVPHVTEDLLHLARTAGRTPLAGAQHLAARRRAEALAPYVDAALVMKELGLARRAVSEDEWAAALIAGVEARSRERLAREIAGALDVAIVGTQEPLFAAGGPSA
jgi:hypothetical protein